MLTILSYLVLSRYGGDYSGFLYVLPVLLDIAIIDKL